MMALTGLLYNWFSMVVNWFLLVVQPDDGVNWLALQLVLHGGEQVLTGSELACFTILL